VPALAARWTRTPIVWLYNDHLPGPLKRLLLPLVTALATIVIVQGEKLKEARTSDNPKLYSKTTVLHSSVDTHRFDPDKYTSEQRDKLKRELGLGPGCAVVGIVGNLNRFKGHTYFLQAAKRIKEATGSVKFLIVGRRLDTDPGCWEQLQQLTAENGLEDDIVYTGFRDDTAAVMAILDVFVLASVLESCPVVVLEAMAMKVPVVATDVGAVSELVVDGQTGFVVPPRSAEAIAEAVLTCLKMPEETVETMTSAARQRVETKFDVDHISERQKHIYEELLDRDTG
jgi:glycosyltransferase involved in cell wall biosynthesis